MFRLTGFGIPTFTGMPILPGVPLKLAPYPRPVHTVVGAPIAVAKFTGPLRGEAWQAAQAELHAKYVAALQALYDAHKGEYFAGRKSELRLVE